MIKREPTKGDTKASTMIFRNEPINLLPHLAALFQREAAVISNSVIDSDHIRRELIIKGLHLESGSLASQLSKIDIGATLKEMDSADENSALFEETRQALPEPFIPFYDSFLQGFSLVDIALELNQSLDHVFKVMRFIERKLKAKTQEAPLAMISQEAWGELVDHEKLALELSLDGFNPIERQKIHGVRRRESADNYKSRALAKLRLNDDEIDPFRKEITTRNMEMILKQGFYHRLLEFGFTNDELRTSLIPKLTYEGVIRRLTSIYEGLSDEDKQLLKLKFEKRTMRDIASRMSIVPIVATRRLEALRKTIRSRFHDYQVLAKPDSKLNEVAWASLDKLHRLVFILMLVPVHKEQILEEVNSNPILRDDILKARRSTTQDKLENVSQVTTILDRAKKTLGLNGEAFKAVRARSKVNIVSESDIEQNAFSLVFPGVSQVMLLTGDERTTLYSSIMNAVESYANGKYLGLWHWKLRGLTPAETLTQVEGFENRRNIADALRHLIDHLKLNLNLDVILKSKNEQPVLNANEDLIDGLSKLDLKFMDLDQVLDLLAGRSVEERIEALSFYYAARDSLAGVRSS